MATSEERLWDDMLGLLHTQHAPLCRAWFREIQPLGVRDGSVVLRVSNDVQRDYLRRECLDALNDAARTASQSLLAIRVLGPGEDTPADEAVPAGPPTNEAPAPAQPPAPSSFGRASESGETRPGVSPRDRDGHGAETPGLRHGDASRAPVAPPRGTPHPSSEAYTQDRDGSLPLDPDNGFENFVVGPGNRLAHAASVAVADNPGRAYNPLFIHGDVGLGKTHLLQGVCIKLLEERRGTRLYYTSCKTFLDDFMMSVQSGQMADFQHRFRDVDVLVIDDIQFLANRDRTQEEFFHTFNSLYQNRKQIVLSSDAAPEEIPDLEDRLVSRFNWGLVTRVDPPSYETRVAIIQTKARLRGLSVPDDVALFIAGQITTNIRELEGAIGKLQLHVSVDQRPIDMDLAIEALGVRDPSAPERRPSVDAIITEVCSYYELRKADLLSKKRPQSISLPRQVAMYLARRMTRQSLEEIGGHFGGRDHTTVLHACKSIDKRRSGDEELDAIVQRLEQTLRDRPQG